MIVFSSCTCRFIRFALATAVYPKPRSEREAPIFQGRA